jgi:hypothetical protein
MEGKSHSRMVRCTGASGAQYSLGIEEIGTIVRADGGVYMFLNLERTNIWRAVYIGETDNLHRCLNEGLRQRHRWNCIKGAGATHVAVLRLSGGQSERRAVAADLKSAYLPSCNQ